MTNEEKNGSRANPDAVDRTGAGEGKENRADSHERDRRGVDPVGDGISGGQGREAREIVGCALAVALCIIGVACLIVIAAIGGMLR